MEKNTAELAVLERDAAQLEKIKGPFIRKTHSQAIEELQSLGSDIKAGDDLGADDETLIMKKYDKPIELQTF